MRLKPCIIESPYGAPDQEILEINRAYLNACILACVRNGYSPYASHKMLTDSLDDSDPEARALGIEAGFIYYGFHLPVFFYLDLGWSIGMLEAAEQLADRDGNDAVNRCYLPGYGTGFTSGYDGGCRFCCDSNVVVLALFDQGCVSHPDDRWQHLCVKHAQSSEPLNRLWWAKWYVDEDHPFREYVEWNKDASNLPYK